MDKTLFELFESKHLAIDEIIKYLPAPICGSTVIDSEKQKEYEAHDLAVIILHKYQKIEEIVGNYGFDTSWICLKKIREVVEDGNDNN